MSEPTREHPLRLIVFKGDHLWFVSGEGAHNGLLTVGLTMSEALSGVHAALDDLSKAKPGHKEPAP